MKAVELAIRDTWSNATIPYLFNHTIIEYDMKRAGLSLIKEHQLLPEETIKQIENYRSKYEQDVLIGQLERKNKALVEGKKQAFASAREKFYYLNDLDDIEIIDIRKDAIFTTRKCTTTKLSEYIEFRPKNTYTSFLRVGKRKIELFYKAPDQIDVKGINDEKVPLHENGMLEFYKTFFRKMESGYVEDTIRFLRYTIDRYKNLDLPIDYYREFNANSSFHTIRNEYAEDYWEDDKDQLDIRYNYDLLCSLAKIVI